MPTANSPGPSLPITVTVNPNPGSGEAEVTCEPQNADVSAPQTEIKWNISGNYGFVSLTFTQGANGALPNIVSISLIDPHNNDPGEYPYTLVVQDRAGNQFSTEAPTPSLTGGGPTIHNR